MQIRYDYDEPLRCAYKFTGKERDAESGLDYFGARYDSSSVGRFMTPDPFLNSGRPANPQTWNRYSYALNNPVTIVDPTGLYNVIDHCAGDKKCEKKLSQAAEALRKSVDKLTDKVSKMKDGEQKTRLQNSLKALENPGKIRGQTGRFLVLSGSWLD
ncbi:MAG: RHS repeat-associated core domain-containing protein [Terriglobia bacterium]